MNFDYHVLNFLNIGLLCLRAAKATKQLQLLQIYLLVVKVWLVLDVDRTLRSRSHVLSIECTLTWLMNARSAHPRNGCILFRVELRCSLCNPFLP